MKVAGQKLKDFMVYFILLLVAFIWIVPTIWITLTALKPASEIYRLPPMLFPSDFTLVHFKRFLMSWPFGTWILNSFILASSVTLISLVVSTLAAFSFARLRWPGRDFVFMMILASMLLPLEVSVIPLFFMMKNFGLINTISGAALPMIALPIGVFLLRQFFLNIPQELEDAAKIDGCSSLGVLIHVIVPNSIPVFVSYAIYIFNYAWNEFFWSMIVLRSPKKITIPVGLQMVQGAFELDYGLITAAAFLASLPSLFVFLILKKRIIRGIALSSGIKR